jgi:hypothetical protein|tara:strand:- start:4645 stop:4971 length:327 start_codon:yes stop_codon:yes gene_type:complete
MNEITIEKARTLIDSAIHKDGVDYGVVTEITTIASSYSRKFVAITDKGYRIDVGSIFRLLNQINGSEKFYPDGTSYSVRVMRSAKRKGSGRAVTGDSAPNNLNTKEKK